MYALVPEARRAWHAGVSYWAGARDINARSIGIELVNPGHEFGYRAFPEAQIAALITLCRRTSCARHPIPALAGAGAQRCRAGAQGRSRRTVSLGPAGRRGHRAVAAVPGSDPGEGAVPGLLAHCGYDPDAPPEKIITAFQRHFRPSRVDGMADAETRRVLSGLIALYAEQKGEST